MNKVNMLEKNHQSCIPESHMSLSVMMVDGEGEGFHEIVFDDAADVIQAEKLALVITCDSCDYLDFKFVLDCQSSDQ